MTITIRTAGPDAEKIADASEELLRDLGGKTVRDIKAPPPESQRDLGELVDGLGRVVVVVETAELLRIPARAVLATAVRDFLAFLAKSDDINNAYLEIDGRSPVDLRQTTTDYFLDELTRARLV